MYNMIVDCDDMICAACDYLHKRIGAFCVILDLAGKNMSQSFVQRLENPLLRWVQLVKSVL